MSPFHSAAALAVLAAGPAAAAADPWALMAARDLDGIHDILAENHPGPVDQENRVFAQRLKSVLTEAKARAAGAKSYADYRRALRFYVVGLRDAHTQLDFELSPPSVWPGFMADSGSDGVLRVAYGEGDLAPLKGAEITACDGEPVARLSAERVEPYFWNADLTQAQARVAWRLFYQPQGDAKQLHACTFRTVQGAVDKTLAWKTIDEDAFFKLRVEALSGGRQMGVRRIDGVWFISIPTFGGLDPKSDAELTALVAAVTEHAADLRAAPKLVIDVRGNGGGNSAWGERVAAALWGPEWPRRVGESFDWTHDFRASDANRQRMADALAFATAQGHAEDADYDRKALAAIDAARAAHQPLGRLAEPPKPMTGPAPDNPVKGKVYLLTDGACGSACLDFADVVRRLPGVTHIGLPTYADAIYMDIAGPKPLPSGLASLRWSMKVYRNRVRANNEWYEPELRWPGGPMTDDAAAAWVKRLP